MSEIVALSFKTFEIAETQETPIRSSLGVEIIEISQTIARQRCSIHLLCAQKHQIGSDFK